MVEGAQRHNGTQTTFAKASVVEGYNGTTAQWRNGTTVQRHKGRKGWSGLKMPGGF